MSSVVARALAQADDQHEDHGHDGQHHEVPQQEELVDGLGQTLRTGVKMEFDLYAS